MIGNRSKISIFVVKVTSENLNMKQIKILVFFFLYNFLSAQNFTVKDFSAEFTVNPEGYFDVVEKYEIEFHSASHGIFRDILIRYYLDSSEETDESKRQLIIKNIRVPNRKYSVNPSTERGQWSSSELRIKIGDPDIWVNDFERYEIRYRVYNAFLKRVDDTTIQFYWNVKSPDWDTTFEKISFKLIVPEGIELSAENSFVYSGSYGETDVSDAFNISYSDNILTAESKENYTSSRGEALTLLSKLPADKVSFVLLKQSMFEKFGWLVIPFLMILYFLKLRKKYGKEKVISITSYYPPKNIDPALAGYLIDDNADTHDLVALIPKWGQEGIIRLEEIPKSGWFGKADLKLIKLKEITHKVPLYERTMFDGLFSGSETKVLVSSLKENFYTTMKNAKSQLEIKAKPYYEKRSRKIILLTSIGVVFGLILVAICYFLFGEFASFAVGATGLILWIMTMKFQRKNPEGKEILSELQGFRQFIRLADVNRIKVLLKDDPNYFEKTMSYALAFGLLKQWAKQFEGLDVAPPEWYGGPMITPGMYSMSNFANSFSDNMSTMKSNMISTPPSSGGGSFGSSGGGFSGGGFGGGGGGSW
jgi:uncharacterized membrane protein YgcG